MPIMSNMLNTSNSKIYYNYDCYSNFQMSIFIKSNGSCNSLLLLNFEFTNSKKIIDFLKKLKITNHNDTTHKYLFKIVNLSYFLHQHTDNNCKNCKEICFSFEDNIKRIKKYINKKHITNITFNNYTFININMLNIPNIPNMHNEIDYLLTNYIECLILGENDENDQDDANNINQQLLDYSESLITNRLTNVFPKKLKLFY